MSELFPIFLASIILAWCSQRRSRMVLLDGDECSHEHLFMGALSVAMVLFAGLRTSYNDTFTYINTFLNFDITSTLLSSIDWKIGNNPGYSLMLSLLKRTGMSPQTYLLCYAIVTVGIYLWFVRKYSTNFWLSVYLMFTLGVYTFTLAAIKQCVAVALCLVATDRALQKKWKAFVLYVLLAAMFHPYSLMYLLVPFLMFCPWSGRTYLLLAAFGIAGVVLEPLLGTIVNITSMIGEEYNAATFSGEGVNVFRVAVCNMPLVLSFMTQKQVRYQNSEKNNLMINLSMLNGEIMFVGLFGTALYFARLANYFLIFQTISIPWMLNHFEPKSKRFMTIAAVVCYFAFFYYQNAINQPFDYYYSGMTLIEYLKSVFR